MAIEWRKREDQALCIEWHKPKNKEHSGSVLIEEITQAVDADDEVKIIEVRYPLPRWLRRLDLYERYQQVPEYLKYINVSAFHNACGESHYALPIHTAANITDLPEWLQRMHTCGDQQRDQQTSFINHKIPGWMKRIRFNKDASMRNTFATKDPTTTTVSKAQIHGLPLATPKAQASGFLLHRGCVQSLQSHPSSTTLQVSATASSTLPWFLQLPPAKQPKAKQLASLVTE